MKKTRKGLGRGLSALIQDADMEFLSRVARGEDIARVSAGKDHGKVRNTASSSAEPEPGLTQAARQNREPKAKSETLDAGSSPEDSDITGGPQPQLARDQQMEADMASGAASSGASLTELIPLAQIEANPYQPRRNFSPQELEELTASIKEHGILQPVLLRPVDDISRKDTPLRQGGAARYQLVAGERRWRASQAAGLKEIPAIVRRVSDQQALELAVIENVQRHDISALDAALAYHRLVHEFSLSQEEVARRVGKSRAAIANTLRLLDLPQEVQKAIEEGIISEGHGRAILLASGDGTRRAVFRRVVREKLSVRSTEELARTIQDSEVLKPMDPSDDEPSAARQQPEVRRIEEGLQKHLGTRVRLRPRKRGGQMVIQYFSNEELERILKLLLR